MTRILAPLSEHERKTLVRLLTKILEHASELAAPASVTNG
jgi:hypothetical protein